MSNTITPGVGLAAFQNATSRMDLAASRIAKAVKGGPSEGKPSDFGSPVVELKEASLAVKTAVRVMETEDKTVGYLLDEKA